jgi:hypothetical protein
MGLSENQGNGKMSDVESQNKRDLVNRLKSEKVGVAASFQLHVRKRQLFPKKTVFC